VPLTKILFEDIFDTFESIYGRSIPQNARDVYWKTLSKFKDDQVKTAAYEWMDEASATWAPTPGQFLAKIMSKLPQMDDLHFGDGYTMKTTYCGKCGAVCMCIKEGGEDWQCRDCYSEITDKAYARRMNKLVTGPYPITKEEILSIK